MFQPQRRKFPRTPKDKTPDALRRGIQPVHCRKNAQNNGICNGILPTLHPQSSYPTTGHQGFFSLCNPHHKDAPLPLRAPKACALSTPDAHARHFPVKKSKLLQNARVICLERLCYWLTNKHWPFLQCPITAQEMKQVLILRSAITPAIGNGS